GRSAPSPSPPRRSASWRPGWRARGRAERQFHRTGSREAWNNPGCARLVEGRSTSLHSTPGSLEHMTEQLETERRTDSINLSPVAAAKVKSLLDQEGRDDLSLRISVQPGGCSGLRYQLFFDERSLDGDVVTDFDGVGVVVDRMSVPYLNGALIDFVDTIEK